MMPCGAARLRGITFGPVHEFVERIDDSRQRVDPQLVSLGQREARFSSIAPFHRFRG